MINMNMNKEGRNINDIEFLPSMHGSLHFILRIIEKSIESL